MKATIMVLIMLMLGIPAALAADSTPDQLPLGPSPYRYELATLEKDQIMDTRSGARVTIPEMVKVAAQTDVFIIGEHHDSEACHRFQRDFIDALFQKYPRLVVGFEFFSRDDDAALDQFRNGLVSEAELLEKTAWYRRTSLNYGYTRMVLEIIQKHRIRTIGLNVPREMIRRVSRAGFNTLKPEEKKLFPAIGFANPEHRFLIKTIFGSFALQVPAWFEGIYQAQTCWDSVMAESMRRVLRQREFSGYKGVIIAGSYHVAFRLGIPFRYAKSDRKARLTTIIPVSLAAGDGGEDEEPNPMKEMMGKNLPEVAVFSRGIGDYVLAVERPAEPFFPVLGITPALSGDRIDISRMEEKGIGAATGLKKGDRILSVDGIRIESLEQFRRLVSEKNWGDTLLLGVEKKIEFQKKPPEVAGMEK